MNQELLQITEDTTKKRGRGRPKKEKPKLPKFENEREVRDFILVTGLELALELKTIAMKKNNIKNHNLSNAKNQQFKTALKSLETVNTILKDKQLDLLSEKIELMELGLTSNSTNSAEESVVNTETLEKLNKLNEELAELKAK